MWFLYAFTSAVLYSFRGLCDKRIVSHANKYVLGLAMRLFAIPFFLIPIILNPHLIPSLSHLSLKFWVSTLIVSMITNPIETLFYYEAIKDEEISLALPILSLSPILTIIFAALTLKERPSIIGILGIIAILFGVYALKIGHAKNGLLEPIKHLHANRSVRMMAVVMISSSIGGIFDKMAVQESNPFFYATINFSLLSLTILIITLFKAPNLLLVQMKSYYLSFLVLGGIVAGYTLFYFMALNTGITSYVIAIKNASILFTILLGITVLKEKDKKSKLLAGVSIFAGLILIKIFG